MDNLSTVDYCLTIAKRRGDVRACIMINPSMESAEMRTELRDFAIHQEQVLRAHDDNKGTSWKSNTPQALMSRVVEELGEVISHVFGQDHVADFLIASLQDHIEECAVNLDYSPGTFRKELADVGNFCMMLHDIANKISPKTKSDPTPRA